MRPRTLALVAVLPLAALTTACGGSAKTPTDAIAIKATDDACDVATSELAAGKHTFAISNKGSRVTEVYVYAAGDKVVAEKENIGPGTSRNLTVNLKAGSYEIACKPGMQGDGIRTPLMVK